MNIILRGLPTEHADAHSALATPGGAHEEGFAVAEYLSYDGIGEAVVAHFGSARLWVEEANEALIDLGFPEQLSAGELGDAVDECTSVPATIVHQRGDT